MRLAELGWMDVEALTRREPRAVLPLGSTEQHAYLSLSTDTILAERVAVEAAEPLGVPVYPVLAYGYTPSFRAFPGTVTLRLSTFIEVVRDVLDGIADTGFTRILVVNGHGGNTPAQALIPEWVAARPNVRVKFHNWWNAPATIAKVREFDPVASHASWMESFPWTRVAGATPPDAQKPLVDLAPVRQLDPAGARALLGDGSFGGRYRRPDAEMSAIWQVAVEETRALLTDGWA